MTYYSPHARRDGVNNKSSKSISHPEGGNYHMLPPSHNRFDVIIDSDNYINEYNELEHRLRKLFPNAELILQTDRHTIRVHPEGF